MTQYTRLRDAFIIYSMTCTCDCIYSFNVFHVMFFSGMALNLQVLVYIESSFVKFILKKYKIIPVNVYVVLMLEVTSLLVRKKVEKLHSSIL